MENNLRKKLEQAIEQWVPIDSIYQDPNNARKHGKKNLDAIKGSIAKWGQVEALLINENNNVIIGGNGRHHVLKEMGKKEVKVLKLDLTEFEACALALALNRTSELAEWDTENLKQQLAQLDLGDFDLKGIGFEDGDFSLDDEEKKSASDDGTYTSKIAAPIYTPTGDKPAINDLFDSSKTSTLIKEINSLDLPKEEKTFLINAAYRHNVFNYQNIAEYYAHSSKEVQDLMEKSALVIIDYNKAIENGFIAMVNNLAEINKDESESEDDE
jgi:hypothetical protein